MDKKPLIGVTICAVVLLVLGSLSNVVGYQSVKSTTMNDSPLFQTRTQKATNQQQNILPSQYLGKGKDNHLQFTYQNNKTEILRKFVRIISSMNQMTFEQSIKLCFDKIQKDNTYDKKTIDKIILILYEIKSKPDTIMKYLSTENNDDQTSYETVCQWHFGCLIEAISILIYMIVFWVTFILYIIINGPTSFTCHSVCMCVI